MLKTKRPGPTLSLPTLSTIRSSSFLAPPPSHSSSGAAASASFDQLATIRIPVSSVPSPSVSSSPSSNMRSASSALSRTSATNTTFFRPRWLQLSVCSNSSMRSLRYYLLRIQSPATTPAVSSSVTFGSPIRSSTSMNSRASRLPYRRNSRPLQISNGSCAESPSPLIPTKQPPSLATRAPAKPLSPL